MIKSVIRKIVSSLGYELIPFNKKSGNETLSLNNPKNHCSHLNLGGLALQKLVENYKFDSVLDIGCGKGDHSAVFLEHHKRVTAVDYADKLIHSFPDHKFELIVGDFNSLELGNQFDCVWACHVLEHQFNPNSFLKKIYQLLKDDGILAITVPPLKNQIVGGHLSLWNGGLLLYHLVMAGFNCRQAKLLKYGYNISVILKKEVIVLPPLEFNFHDIEKLSPYFPEGLGNTFNGNIEDIGWS